MHEKKQLSKDVIIVCKYFFDCIHILVPEVKLLNKITYFKNEINYNEWTHKVLNVDKY